MKRLLCFIVTAALLLSLFGFVASAAENVIVYSDSPLSTKQGEELTVPINVKNNSGLMGFRITVNYPDEQLKLKNISSGSVTKSGLFNTTVSSYDLVKGSFDILWSDTKENKADGSLAVLTFNIKPSASDGEYNISLNYSKDDTFDGAYKDVALKCVPVSVTVGEKKQSTEANTDTSDKYDTGGEPVSDDYLINSVKEAENSFGKTDIDKLNEQEQKTLVEYVNNRIGSYDKNAKKFRSFEQVKQAYKTAAKNEAVKKVLESTDDDKIIKAKNEVLKEYGVKSFSEIPKEKQTEAAEKMLNKLADVGAEVEGFQNTEDTKETVEALDELIKQAKKRQKEAIDIKEESEKIKRRPKVILALAISACAVLAAVAVTALVLAKKRRKTK